MTLEEAQDHAKKILKGLCARFNHESDDDEEEWSFFEPLVGLLLPLEAKGNIVVTFNPLPNGNIEISVSVSGLN